MAGKESEGEERRRREREREVVGVVPSQKVEERQTDRQRESRAQVRIQSTALKIEELENWTGQFGVVCGLYLEKTKSHQKGY